MVVETPQESQKRKRQAIVKTCPVCESWALDLQLADPSFDWFGWAKCVTCGHPFNAAVMITQIQEKAKDFCEVILVDPHRKELAWSKKDYGEAMDRISNWTDGNPEKGLVPVYRDRDLGVLAYENLHVVFVIGHAKAFYKFIGGLKRKRTLKEIQDPFYGGVHFTLKMAEERIARGCPSFDLLWPYISPGKRSLVSRKDIGEFKALVDQHLNAGCPDCRFQIKALTLGTGGLDEG